MENNFTKISEIKTIKRLEKNVNNTNDVLISFVMPTFKRPDTIIESIESILALKALDTVPYEIIVLDNSADLSEYNSTYRILSNIEASNFSYYVNEINLGMEGNWNRGVEIAKGKFISYLHDDDLLDEDYLENILVAINKINERIDSSQIGFIKAAYEIYTTGNCKMPLKKENGMIKKKRLFEVALTGESPTGTPSCGIVFSKDAFKKIGGFNTDYFPSADAEIGVRMLLNGYKGYMTCSQLGYYRIGKNESMKLGTIQGFIEKNSLIRQMVYNNTWYGVLLKNLWEGIIYTRDIDYWIGYSKKYFEKDISINELDFKHCYKKRRMGLFLFRCVYKIYRIIYDYKF